MPQSMAARVPELAPPPEPAPGRADPVGDVVLAVEHVSLVFPLYAKTATEAPVDPTAESGDDRLICDPHGRMLGVRALQNVSFAARRGDRLALIGRNGSGKTTLLQVLAGILTPDSGQVSVWGPSTNLININLGMRPDATGHRNITLRGLAAGRSRREIEAKRAEIAAFSELGHFLNLPVSTYSAGMRMRLNFAIATAFEPEILILDEWISAGDAAFRKKATERMHDFVGQAGLLILASHSRSMLMENCNRAIWLERGRVKADGGVKEVIQAYEAETAGAER